jgi:glucose-1-phosphate cytidylyltransferase
MKNKIPSNLDVVLLAGGLGTRLGDETSSKPKPMVEVGGKPIIVHIIEHYIKYGLKRFIICGGYKIDYLKNYFANFLLFSSDIKIELGQQKISYLSDELPNCEILIINTGLQTQTGGRLKKIKDFLKGDNFMFTYGDAVSDVDLDELWDFHVKSGKKCTVTMIRPSGRFGNIVADKGVVSSFTEKPTREDFSINGGFFVAHSDTLDLVASDDTPWESQPMQELVKQRELAGYAHQGFWHCMDTPRDKDSLDAWYARSKNSR